MRKYGSLVLSSVFLMSFPALVGAASLQVAPVSVEIPAPGAAAMLTLRNEGTGFLNAQIRVFRWAQVNGEEKLEPTDDVVASPPMAVLAPKTSYVVRLVRVTKQPISSEESYRLLVDELPDPTRQRNGVVAMVLRYSIPVFFYPPGISEAKLTWSAEQRGARTYVSATNDGDRHVRISELKLRNGDGTTVSFGSGLTGYVLGHSSMRWAAAGSRQRLGAGNSVVITAQGDRGPINASPSLQPAR